jgi:hypothetical protein
MEPVMDSQRVHVRNVRGRYPHGGTFRSDNIEAQVHEEARVIRISIDDAENPEAWFEITLELDG